MAPENCSFSRTKEEEEEEEENVAVIFGVTGLVGREIAKRLSSKPRWKIFGIARNPEIKPTNNGKIYTFISCDLLNPSETRQKLSPLQEIVTHAFWVTWSGEFPLDTDECCEQNSRMMANALGAILPNARRLKHFSLQTGMKHYVSLRDPLFQTLCYYSEECPRARSGRNFYYALEDLLHEKLSGNNTLWSVHRPGLLLGSSTRTLYNFMGTLCVYGAICKYLNLPFVFGGTRECWEESYIDGSDSRLVAEQHIYAATSGKVSEKGEAFNAVNGFRFSWKELWPQIGKKLGVQVTETEMFNEGFWYEREMAEKNRVWDEIVEKERLARTEVGDLANWRFMDMLFRCPFKLLGTRDKADRLGFKRRFRTLDSILHWIDVMRDEKLIPHTRDRPPFV
ncbi:PREDICTED: iridoid synthase isoform X1 [Tarenaya hassleriana]|uniref:iridoid synthase isoform X1 n=1 Tax=Tarenaya hassleriana TaxID=28532 RepID=UPI00053C27B3|nr:PREDICTED: iridoid synthase isoform X1 [Tarenaya hassleriana]